MNSKNKINTKKNMDKLINSLGSLIAALDADLFFISLKYLKS